MVFIFQFLLYETFVQNFWSLSLIFDWYCYDQRSRKFFLFFCESFLLLIFCLYYPFITFLFYTHTHIYIHNIVGLEKRVWEIPCRIVNVLQASHSNSLNFSEFGNLVSHVTSLLSFFHGCLVNHVRFAVHVLAKYGLRLHKKIQCGWKIFPERCFYI